MKVLITTSGLGSRLGEISKYTNKSLIKIGDKAAISHIIDIYPDITEFVITLGYFGDHVQQFLELAYPAKKFEFVTVNPFVGEGSGLLKSMSFAKDNLQCSFIFHACDTILIEQPPVPHHNYMACTESSRSDFFRTVRIDGDVITKINEKGEMEYDYAYIGVAGIHDYELFWKELNILLKNEIVDSSDCHVFNRLLSQVPVYYWNTKKHYDTGSVENLNETRKAFKTIYNVLDKHEESIYFDKNSVIKFFSDEELCYNRVLRAEKLKGIVPKIMDYKENFYKYKLAKGKLLADVITEYKIKQLLSWAEKNLWKDVKSKDFIAKCRKFYIKKTGQRIQKYLGIMKIEDGTDNINEIKVHSCNKMMSMIDWDRICDTSPVQFHGDFILDNILYNNGDFTLLDWRQDFGGCTNAGDKYYDLSKLNHNLTLNHDILSKKLFTIETKRDMIYCDILRSSNMVQCQQQFYKSAEERGYDLYKIKILTPIIWLNMSPLHIYPLNKFLFYFGKYNLWRELNEE